MPDWHMEIRQARYFESVARAGSFSRAAGELGMTQPALSRQVKALEDEWGDDVNQAGSVQKLVDRAQEAFGGFDSAFIRPGVHILADFQSATVEKFQGSVEGNMLSVMYALQALLPPLMARGSGQVLIEVSATGSKDWPGTGFLYGATRAGQSTW